MYKTKKSNYYHLTIIMNLVAQSILFLIYLFLFSSIKSHLFSSHLLSISLFTYSLPTTKHIHIPLNQTHPKVYLPCTEPDNQRWNERVLAPKQASWSNIQCSPRLGCTDSLGACRTLSYLYKINK